MSWFQKSTPPPFISAVVAAAGAASRMEGVDKQQALVDGMPVVARSVAALAECSRVAEVVIVCREEQIANYYDLVRYYGLSKVTSVVAGGKDRQESVFAGIAACDERAEYFAIHDGARPLVETGDVERCIDAAIQVKAAAVGVPVRDTIKVCDGDGAIISTPRRDRLWVVQTPQIFEANLYRMAMAAAIRDSRSYTDDCQLVENFGHSVIISPGSHGNIKITVPEDIAIANAILEFRTGGFM